MWELFALLDVGRGMTRSVRVLLALLVLTPAAVAFAQDAPFNAGSTGPKPPSLPAPVAAPKPVAVPLGDVDARLASVEAENARKRAVCLIKAAQRIDEAARALDRASKDVRSDRRRALSEAVIAVDACDDVLGFTELAQARRPRGSRSATPT